MNLFYWHSKIENGNTLREELMNLDKINTIKIASAYFSAEGLDILKELRDRYSLKKHNIHLYLSPEFSMNKPHKLLEELAQLCEVYIVFNIRFHPKVYWIKSNNNNKLIFGSSNFTKGGFADNIEFDSISEIDEEHEKKLNMFFSYCHDNSELVNEELIKFYMDKEEEIYKLNEANKAIKKALNSYETRNDEFQETDYNLEKMYFTYEDYEIFFLRNQSIDNETIYAKRKKTRDKILRIHDKVYSTLNKENIHCHWRDENITSLIRPCEFNFGRVGWIGVRYGKHKSEVNLLKDMESGFQKHSCLQFCISSIGFEINLFHAVRRDAIDRDYLHSNINKLKNKIIAELDNLKGQNFVWVISDSIENKEYKFEIDNRESAEFIEFYKNHDKEGRESCMAYYLEPDDSNLRDLNSISKVVVDKIKMLLPLYNLLAFRPQW